MQERRTKTDTPALEPGALHAKALQGAQGVHGMRALQPSATRSQSARMASAAIQKKLYMRWQGRNGCDIQGGPKKNNPLAKAQ